MVHLNYELKKIQQFTDLQAYCFNRISLSQPQLFPLLLESQHLRRIPKVMHQITSYSCTSIKDT